VPFTYRKYFNTEQITEMVTAFKAYDQNSDGTIDAREFKTALQGMGHGDISDEQVQKMLTSVDKNADGVIEWIEFLDMMQMVKSSGQ
jgi:calcium-binding protein CML